MGDVWSVQLTLAYCEVEHAEKGKRGGPRLRELAPHLGSQRESRNLGPTLSSSSVEWALLPSLKSSSVRQWFYGEAGEH